MRNKSSKLDNRFFLWRLMNTVDERKAFFYHKMGNGLIGSDHKLFNHLMSKVSICPNDVLRLSLEIQNDLRFREVKINGPPSHSSSTEFLTERGHEFQGWEKISKLILYLRISVHQYFFHQSVG